MNQRHLIGDGCDSHFFHALFPLGKAQHPFLCHDAIPVGRAGGRDEQGLECAHGIAHQRLVAQPAWIRRIQAAVNFRQRNVQIVAIHRQIRRHRRSRGVFHELEVKRAADKHGGEAVFIDQLGQRQGGFGQPMSAQTGNDVNHVRLSRLQPECKFQFFVRRRNQDRPCLATAREFRILEGEEDGFKGFERSRVLFALHLKIRHPVRPRERPGILNLGIRVHFGLTEPHIPAHAVGEIVIHDPVIEITIRTEPGQRIIGHEFVGGDVKQRIGGRVGGEAECVALIAGSVNRQHQKELRLPAPLAERLAKIRVRFLNLPLGRHVEDAGDAGGGVASKPVGFIAGAAPLSL